MAGQGILEGCIETMEPALDPGLVAYRIAVMGSASANKEVTTAIACSVRSLAT